MESKKLKLKASIQDGKKGTIKFLPVVKVPFEINGSDGSGTYVPGSAKIGVMKTEKIKKMFGGLPNKGGDPNVKRSGNISLVYNEDLYVIYSSYGEWRIGAYLGASLDFLRYLEKKLS